MTSKHLSQFSHLLSRVLSMLSLRLILKNTLFGIAFVLFTFPSYAQNNGWEQYKDRFLMPDGRIIDTGNRNISHSEGQGFAMLLAVYNNDQSAFNSIWNWTRRTLYRQDIRLFSWRYDPNQTTRISDPNNATDGDIFIAWALLEAGKKWRSADYVKASTVIQDAILKGTLIHFSGYTLLLPGVHGFNHRTSVVVNPSYFVFPAFMAFYQESGMPIWKTINDDALRMLGKMNFGTPRIATDWVSLQNNGRMVPAANWPPIFSFDAVRIPLYLNWYQDNHPLLQPYRLFWQRFPRERTPAWVNVRNNTAAPYNLSPGMVSIRDITLGNAAQVNNILTPTEDYYSASLHLLAYWSLQR